MPYEESDELFPEWMSTSTVLSQNEVHPDAKKPWDFRRCPHVVLKGEERNKIGETYRDFKQKERRKKIKQIEEKRKKDWKLKRPKQESNNIIKTEAHGEAPHHEDFSESLLGWPLKTSKSMQGGRPYLLSTGKDLCTIKNELCCYLKLYQKFISCLEEWWSFSKTKLPGFDK